MSPNALDRSDQHLRPISIFFSFFLSFLFRYNLLPVVYVCKAPGEASRRNISRFIFASFSFRFRHGDDDETVKG